MSAPVLQQSQAHLGFLGKQLPNALFSQPRSNRGMEYAARETSCASALPSLFDLIWETTVQVKSESGLYFRLKLNPPSSEQRQNAERTALPQKETSQNTSWPGGRMETILFLWPFCL